jgi:hypothetical protein
MENEEFVDFLDNRDHMLREAKKIRKELRSLLDDARTRVAELETQVLDSKLEINSLKASPIVSDEIDCADCFVFLVDLTDIREKYASKCEELDVLRVELAELQSRPTLLGACTSCPGLHEKVVELHSRIASPEAVPPQSTPKDKFAPKPNQLLKLREKPSEKPCEEPHPKPKPRSICFHCEFCGKDCHKK